MKKSCLVGAACALLSLASLNVTATDRYWVCGSNDWNQDSCWSPVGAPLVDDSVYLIDNSNVDKTVTISNTSFAGSNRLNTLTVDGTGALTVSQISGDLASSNGYVGYDSIGIYSQSDGNNIFGGNLYLGYNNASQSTYNLSGGKLSSQGLYIGYNTGSTGTINISGTGEMYAFGGFIGYGGTGTINQTGGDVKTANTFSIGNIYNGQDGYGTYNLSAGTLYGGLYVSPNGTVNQNGGTYSNALDWLHVDTGGVYNLNGGLINNGQPAIISGTFNQTGGRHTSSVDSYNRSIHLNGNYNLSGGILDVPSIQVDNPGIFHLSGGEANVDVVDMRGGTFNFTGGSLDAAYFIGSFVNDGGNLAPGGYFYPEVVYPGDLMPTTYTIGLTGITGNYTQTIDGVYSAEIGGLIQGAAYDLVNVAGTASLAGTLKLSLANIDGSGLFSPNLGDTFDILLADTIIGEFDILTLAVLDGGLDWDISYILDDLGTDFVRLSVVQAVPVPPSVWLFGSGLLGLVGIARKKAST